MDSLRILHVTPYAADAWAYGGVPRVASVLARELAAAGHHVTTCSTDARDRSSRTPRQGARHLLAPFAPVELTPRHILRVFPNLSNRLAHDAQLFLPIGLRAYFEHSVRTFDIVHLHACRNIPGVLAARACRRARIPYVLSPHGTAPRIERRLAAKRMFDILVGNRLLREAAAILAVSNAERRQLATLGVSDARIHVVPNPIDLAEWAVPPERGRFRQRFELGDRPIVMFLGKLTPRKRVDVLIDAFASLPLADARLVVAGNDMGAGSDLLRRAAERGVGPRTLFTGLLAGRDRLDALADADVVVYPSAHEIFGLVPIESILSGTPVVVSDDSGCGEVIAEVGGGVVTPVGDVQAVAKAVESILADLPAWRGAVTVAAVKIRTTLDSAVIARRTAEVYADVISATNGRGYSSSGAK